MKVYIVKNVYVAQSGLRYTSGILKVFSRLESLLVYFNNNKKSWESKFSDGRVNYFDLETFDISNGGKILHYIVYGNDFGFFNNPQPFKNELEAKRMQRELISKGRKSQLKSIEIE